MALSRRHWLISAGALPIASFAAGCAGFQPPGLTFRTMAEGARPLAYQAASFLYAFADSNSRVTVAVADKVEAHALPLAEALDAKGAQLTVTVRGIDVESGDLAYQTYALELHIEAGGEPPADPIPGEQGTDEGVYVSAIEAWAAYAGIDPATLRAGHEALFGYVASLTSLNVEAAAMRRHAFALLAVREAVKQGAKADWMDPNRPAEATSSDIQEAHALIVDDLRRVEGERALVIAALGALSRHRQPGALDLTKKAVDTARSRAQSWMATHARPTAEDFGVQPAALPDPTRVETWLGEELGLIASAIKVARGIASGDIASTLEGLKELTPEDTRLHTALSGLEAVSKGDVRGVAEAVAKLAGKDEEMQSIHAIADDLDRLATEGPSSLVPDPAGG